MDKVDSRLNEMMLARVLRVPIVVSNVSRQTFGPGPGVRDEVITTSRVILIVAGALHYTIEGNDFVLEAGTQFLVPAWVRRSWMVPVGGGCELLWCEFDDDPREIGRGSCFRRTLVAGKLRYEKNAYREMLRMWAQYMGADEIAGNLVALGLEGEVKSMLARFWTHPQLDTSLLGADRPLLHPEIKRALRWLEEHFRDADVLPQLERTCGFTPNYFRQRFRDSMSCSPNVYVQRLRMRHARYLLHATDWQLKRIAGEVGYRDPLYFSKLYRRFWGHPPSSEREEID